MKGMGIDLSTRHDECLSVLRESCKNENSEYEDFRDSKGTIRNGLKLHTFTGSSYKW